MNLDTEIKGISDSYNNIFDSLRNTMEKEGKEYSRNVSEVRNPFVKAKLYDRVSYKNTWDVIERYMNPKL